MWNIRDFADNAFRPFDFVTRLPRANRSLPVVMSSSTKLKFLATPMATSTGSFSLFLRQFMKPGTLVWDAGAYMGLQWLAAAALAGKPSVIYVFKRGTWLVRILCRTSNLRPFESASVAVFPVAVASAVELRTFGIAKRSRQTSHIEGYGTSQVGGTWERHTVIAITLDWALDQIHIPDLLKADAEGADLEVLHETVDLLKKVRPAVLCEIGDPVALEVSDVFHACSNVLLSE